MLHVDGELPYANNFSKPAVAATSRAILQRFGTWNNESLEDHQMFTFNPNSVDTVFEPGAYCLTDFDQARQDGECWQASTISVRLDEDTAWLVVLVLPAAAFAQKSSEVARDATIQVQGVEESSDLMVTWARQWTASVALAVLLLSACLGTCLGFHVSSRLRELADLTQRLSNLDFTQPSKLKSGCGISDVTNLQQAFCGLTRGIEAFARFVPEPVVRSLVHGQNIKMEERRVTILCSDIEGFTKISETLGHVELLFMLTRYLSVMQRVVHMYKGVVAEILGDGLLIYWNTPDDVENHAELACAAAVLMQDKVMDLLNDEFSSVDLPQIKIRIGIHTALVSSGTVGSEMKKKFGCLGPGVDIADHLESSCKGYQKQTLVSERTLDALSPDSGFSFSEVGVEQIEGEELKIYELIGRDWSPGGDQAEEGEMSIALEGPEDATVTPVTIDITRTASPSGQHQSPGGFVGMNAVRSRRSNASRVSFGREPSMESGYGAGRALSRRTNWQDDVDAAQAVAESGESLQRNSALFSNEGMLRLLQSTSSVASLSDPTSLAHLVRL
jgi:class 3 adenylate cyclase